MRLPTFVLMLTLVSGVWGQEMTGGGPEWPMGFKFPKETVATWNDPRSEKALARPEADVWMWTPPGAESIRAVMMFADNTDLVKIGEHKQIRDVATRQGIGILYLKSFSGKVIEFADSPVLAEETFRVMLDEAAKRSGIAEFRHAPWILLGKSSRGAFAFKPAWAFPERIVATISYHGETPTWPMADWSKAGGGESPLHLNIQGLSEWDGTWYRHVRPALLNYNRNTKWLAHQMVIYGVDHGYYMDYFLYPNHGAKLDKDHKFTRVTQVWDYIAQHIDTAMEMKVPKEGRATEAPLTLLPVDRGSGWLLHPRAIEELLGTKWFALRQGADGTFQTIPWPQEPSPVFDEQQGRVPLNEIVRPAKEVPEAEWGNYMWIADRELLSAWLDLHNLYKLKDRVLPPLTP